MNRIVRHAIVPIMAILAAATLTACGSSNQAPTSAAAAAELTAIAAAQQSGQSSGIASSVPSVAASSPVEPPAGSSAESSAGESANSSAAAGALVMDPCLKLTKADVQPFFTVPIATELPESWDTATTKGCSFSAAGIVGTTLSIKVVGGDDAQTMDQLQKTDTQEVTFSGVGVTAEHPHGSTEFTAQEGTTANPSYCGVSTTGWKQLAGKKDVADVTDIPDATATMIDQQYGTLCNKLFGTGTQTPTMTVAAPASSNAVSSAPAGPVLPIGGTIGAGFPIPQGLDCSGSKTTTSDGEVECYTTSPNGKAIYDFYLSVLPTKGFTINHESEGTGANGTEVASLLFEGPGAGGFSALSIVGKYIDITLMKA